MTRPALPLPPGPAAPSGHRRGAQQVWLAIAMIAAAVALRIALADYPFWFDEYASLVFAREPLSHLWGPWMVRETNPPLFYTLAKGWHAVVGDSIVALRLLPIFGSACSMALLALVARRAYGPGAVLPALVLYGLSGSAIFISHQFRGYIFCEVGVLIALAGLVAIVQERDQALRNHALYVAGSALAIYSHTSMLLWPVVATGAMLAWFALRRRASFWRVARRLIVADLCLLVIAGWLLWLAILQLRAGAPNVSWMKPADLKTYSLLVTQNIMLAFHPSVGYPMQPGPRVAKHLVELSLLLAAVRTAREDVTQLFGGLLALGAATLWLAQEIHPIASDRTVHWLSLFVLLIIAGGLARIRATPVRLAVLAIPAVALAANLVAERDKLVIAIFPGPLAGYDPSRLAVITEHRSDALVFLQGCRMYWHRPECPVQLIPLDSTTTADSWADGMLDEPLLTADQARAVLPADRAIFTYRHGTRDPLRVLGLVTATAPGRARIEGPFTRTQLLGRQPLPPEFQQAPDLPQIAQLQSPGAAPR